MIINKLLSTHNIINVVEYRRFMLMSVPTLGQDGK